MKQNAKIIAEWLVIFFICEIFLVNFVEFETKKTNSRKLGCLIWSFFTKTDRVIWSVFF